MRRQIAQMLLSGRTPTLRAKARAYEASTAIADVAAFQTARFNRHWAWAWRHIPFYSHWRDRHALPAKIDDISELAVFPVLTKHVLAQNRELVRRTPNTKRYTLTGGTSGLATAFPMNRLDADAAWRNTHIGRRWNGLQPQDRLFMIWGHSHLFSGPMAQIKQAKRRVKDWAANTDRASAYDLTPVRLDQIADQIATSKPRFVIGYGSCLAKLCYRLRDLGRNLHAANVTRVVNTSETIGVTDASMVSDTFGCEVINEYGMAEAGVIGYSRDALYPVRVFWRDYALRLDNRHILLTTLGRRCFPLINYDTEDLSDDPVAPDKTLVALNTLLGKARDVFEIRDIHGRSRAVSVVLLDHILKQIPTLRSLHYRLTQTGLIEVGFTHVGDLPSTEQLRRRLVAGLAKEGIHIAPTAVAFHRLEEALQTPAGKRLAVERAS